MKFQMAKNSLFAVLLRSPWWISAGIALALGALGFVLLPEKYRIFGAVSGLPFAVIAVIAAYRQWHLPSAARVAQTHEAVSKMAWPAFAALLEQAFVRDGYTVQRGKTAGVDFEIERQGRRMVVSARRWKSAHIGLEALRALQAVREASETRDALFIGLGLVSESARPFAAAHHIAVWQVDELAHALRGLKLG